MQRSLRLTALTVLSVSVLAACGGGDSAATATTPPTGEVTDQDRIGAARATVAENPKCSTDTLGAFFWEIGDRNGVKVSGSVGSDAPTASTSMWVYSASKWLYAANVVEKRGVVDRDVPFLNFTSGFTEFGNLPACLGDTIESCLLGRDGQDPATIGKYFYDSGHMQHHAANVMNLGAADNQALAADLNGTVGNFGFSYTVPQPASGVVVSPEGYASFLRKMLRGELALAAALGRNKVCANPLTSGCNALSSPALGGNEAWNYSLGHWVEDDPNIGDGAFSSAGGGGFYPWIDKTKTYYGLVARERSAEGDAGYHSAECGRLVRQAWVTGLKVSSSAPTP